MFSLLFVFLNVSFLVVTRVIFLFVSLKCKLSHVLLFVL